MNFPKRINNYLCFFFFLLTIERSSLGNLLTFRVYRVFVNNWRNILRTEQLTTLSSPVYEIQFCDLSSNTLCRCQTRYLSHDWYPRSALRVGSFISLFR